MPRTYIDSQRLLSRLPGFSRCSSSGYTGAFQKDWICSVFTKTSFHSYAYHTAIKYSNKEHLRTFFLMPKEIPSENLSMI